MKAYTCDRCNRLYTEQELIQFINHHDDLYYRVRKETIPDIYSHDLDLCPECSSALKKFIELKGIPT